jgi:queuine tRNA-ribosyltransferase
MNHFKFELIHQSSKSRARVGRIHTPHGIIDTPNFVAVGTNGSVKSVDSQLLEEVGLQLIFCNTYHLVLQPGSQVIKTAGGIHKFMNRKTPIITDSGGFQVFSLAYGGVSNEIKSKGTKKHDATVLKINEEGVTFRSYRDGTKVHLSPETSIAAQKEIGADIIVAFDELPPYHISACELQRSFDRTHRWQKRSLNAHKSNIANQAMYAVIHGGVDKNLRRQSCEILCAQDFDGFGVGGSIGKNRAEMVDLLKYVMPILPINKSNHLLGIGDLPSIKECIPLGIDTFDSSHPTKAARHGLIFTKNGCNRIYKSGNSTNFGPLEEGCTCHTCQNYSTAYLLHLFRAKELTAFTLATIHNLHFMVNLMQDYRKQILNNEI